MKANWSCFSLLWQRAPEAFVVAFANAAGANLPGWRYGDDNEQFDERETKALWWAGLRCGRSQLVELHKSRGLDLRLTYAPYRRCWQVCFQRTSVISPSTGIQLL